MRIAARAGAAGSVVAGIVYWAALAPLFGVGTQLVTILANVFVHAVLPVAIIVRLVHGAERFSIPDELATIAWPLLYLAFTVVLMLSGGQSPYTWLRPSEGANLWVSVATSMGIWFVIVFILHGVLRLTARRGTAASASSGA